MARRPHIVATFSIVGADPDSGEVGVAVASKFFAVGSVVPWARAGAGAVATQSFANTNYGPDGLDLLEQGSSAESVVARFTDADDGRARRQFGIVAANGDSATYTGSDCVAWSGGRSGPGYAAQGNILTGEHVVEAMEEAFLSSRGDLTTRLFEALVAGDRQGGDARGRQSAALLVARPEGGYGGFNDRYIDIRVDDHLEPFSELERLQRIAHVDGRWNLGWTAYTKKTLDIALPHIERAAELAAEHKASTLGEVLYDLAVIRGACGDTAGALRALRQAVDENPRLRGAAHADSDFDRVRDDEGFVELFADR